MWNWAGSPPLDFVENVNPVFIDTAFFRCYIVKVFLETLWQRFAVYHHRSATIENPHGTADRALKVPERARDFRPLNDPAAPFSFYKTGLFCVYQAYREP